MGLFSFSVVKQLRDLFGVKDANEFINTLEKDLGNDASFDTISEETAGAGVTIDGLKIKDGKLLGTLSIPIDTGTLALLEKAQTFTNAITFTNALLATEIQAAGTPPIGGIPAPDTIEVTPLFVNFTGITSHAPEAINAAGGVTSYSITKNTVTLTVTGAQVVTTLTGGIEGQRLTIICEDANITFTDTAVGGAANTIVLSAALVSANGTTLTLIKSATQWLELSRSIN